MLSFLQSIVDIFFPKPKTAAPVNTNLGTSKSPGLVSSSPPPPKPATTAPAPQPPPGIPFDPTSVPNVNGRYGGNYDQEIILDLIDSLQKPPPQVTQDYVTIISRVASFLGRPQASAETLFRAVGAKASWDGAVFPEQHIMGFTVKNVRQPVIVGNGPDSQEKMRNFVNMGRNDIYDVINRVNAFVARAKNAGFVPPENPFALAMSFNVGRMGFKPVNLSYDQSTRIAGNVRSYLKLLDAERSGQLNLDKNAMKAAQLSSAKLSLEGFGGTGNTSLDLAKLLPDADEVKAQKAFEALSVFDFTKRIPKVLFTSFYAPGGVPKGVIVGWKKVADASGYVIKRRNIFDGRETTYSVTNEQIKDSTARLNEYVRAWILSFYDNVQPDFVFSFLDADVPAHAYFLYKIQAYQLQNEVPGTMFAVETSPVYLSAAQKVSIRNQLEKLDPNPGSGNGQNKGVSGSSSSAPDTISPYPVLAHVLLGSSKYDWLLAAVNIRSSINRGDTRTTTRGYSYLAAQLDFLFAQADAGRFIVPKDVSRVLSNVGESISKFGVNQVLKEVLQETGTLYHFEGKDASDNALFRNVETGQTNDSGLVSIVAGAIDPETATLDLNVLSTNLPKLVSGEYVDINTTLKSGATKVQSKAALPGEIEVPAEFDHPTDTRPEDDIQFLQKMGNLADGVVDMTTVDGISTFMRTIRIFSDVGPSRGAPITSTSNSLVPDPVKVPLPPAPPPSPQQPVQPPFIEAGETDADRRRREEQARKEAEAKKARDLELAQIRIDIKKNLKGF